MSIIKYELFGNDLQLVEIELEPNQSVVSEAGAMMMMDNSILMDTHLKANPKSGGEGLFGKLGGAAKRVLAGESFFITSYTNTSKYDNAKVSFASPFPGQIIPLDLSNYNNKIICQKGAFLCGESDTSIGIEFKKNIVTGFLGGEGFILQKLEGQGFVFIHAGGTIVKKELRQNEILKVDTGCLVAMTKDVHYGVEYVGSKNLFGGEGVALATLKGPGTVWVQSLPFDRLASKIISKIPRKSSDD